jgi:hypothetical protein
MVRGSGQVKAAQIYRAEETFSLNQFNFVENYLRNAPWEPRSIVRKTVSGNTGVQYDEY